MKERETTGADFEKNIDPDEEQFWKDMHPDNARYEPRKTNERTDNSRIRQTDEPTTKIPNASFVQS